MEIANYVDKVRLMGSEVLQRTKSSIQEVIDIVVQLLHILMSSITNQL